MKNTKNPMKNKNVVPEFAVVYTVDGGGNRGQGDTRQDYTMNVVRLGSRSFTSWATR
jgi:hypothetical protein